MKSPRIFVSLVLLVGALACEPTKEPAEDVGVAEVGADSGGFDGVEEPDSGIPADAPRVRVATFNVRLLFDQICDSGRCGPRDFEDVPSEQEYRLTLERTAEAIAQIDADVVLVQEVETQAVLDDLRAQLGAEYGVAVLGETGFDASVDVGVISRGTLVETREYRELRPLDLAGGRSARFAREFLQVELEVEGQEVIVFSAHFVSKVNDDPERRLAEAREARKIVDEVAALNPEALVVLGGDFNDTPDSAPLQALVGDGELVRAGAELPADQMWSYQYRGQFQSIDHLIVARTQGGAYIPMSASSVSDSVDGSLADSDHGAIKADFAVY